MKLTFGRVTLGNGNIVLLPRTEFANEAEAEKEGGLIVSLARSGSSCRYPAANFLAHDGHAPRWTSDGVAPPLSTAPGMTAEQYMQRIVADLQAQGATVDLQPITEVPLEKSAYAPGLQNAGEPEKGESWEHYGVDDGKDDEKDDEDGD